MKYAIIENAVVVKTTFIDAYAKEVFAAKIPEDMGVVEGDGYVDGIFTRNGEPLLDRLGQALKELDEANATIAQLRSRIDEMGKTVLEGDGTADSPFVLEAGTELVPNAYYSYNDQTYVYMGAAGVADETNMPTGNSEEDFSAGWATM